MKTKSLKRIVNALGKVFSELRQNDVADHVIRQRYAEYLVASILAGKGHSVCLLGERENRESDIYLPDKEIRIEIKSGKTHDDGWAVASFGVGNQIKKAKFDFCIFAVFGKSAKENVEHLFVLTRDELKEVATRRKRVAAHEETNPCLLLYCPSLVEYNTYIKEAKTTAFKIERQLIKNPNRFDKKWNRIK